MAKTINKVELLGRVGADPEMKYTASGVAVTQLRLATDRVRKGGEAETDWHSVVAWDKLAEAVSQYVEKGQRIYVAGRLAQNSWTGTTGSGATAPRFTPRTWCSWTRPATATAAVMGTTATTPTPATGSTPAPTTSPPTRTLPSSLTASR